MITKVTIPKFDANIVEVTVGSWFVKEGTAVHKKESLVELITDKIAFEYEAPASGVLRKILAREKSVVPVGYILALIGDPNEPLPDVERFNQRQLAKSRNAAGSAHTETRAAAGPPPHDSPAVRATPAARRLAREHGLDLRSLKPMPAGAAITEEMVRARLAHGGSGGPAAVTLAKPFLNNGGNGVPPSISCKNGCLGTGGRRAVAAARGSARASAGKGNRK